MLVKMKSSADGDIKSVADHVKAHGCEVKIFKSEDNAAVAVLGEGREQKINLSELSALSGVEKVYTKDYFLTSRAFKNSDTVVKVGDVTFGGGSRVVMAGPCAIESYEQTDAIGKAISAMGVKVMRGGAFKPRTSAYSFQGLGIDGLKIGREVADKYGMLFVTELTDARYLEAFTKYVDIIQVGARNSQNFELLKDLGTCGKPILLKQGMSDNLDTWLSAAEYIYSRGNERIILCERGINGTDNKYYRNVTDINALLAMKKLTHLPLCMDPSHGSGRRDFIEPLSCMAVIAGTDALLIEVHNCPECALCDGAQSLHLDEFKHLLEALKVYEEAYKNASALV